MKYCLICFEDVYHKTSLLQYFQKEDCICGACASKFLLYQKSICFHSFLIDALYVYNDFLESLLFQLKEGRDIALKDVFLRNVSKQLFTRYQGYTLVFMPSSKQKTKERGFFALAELFAQVSLPKMELFEKTKDVKQSIQPFHQRSKIKDCLVLKKDIKLPKTKILLVDDVCTSGSTLKSAYELIEHHTYEVRAFVIGVHPRFIKSCD